ncbi:hypothetical protein BCR35DRAFT_330368 [Leucosporidium creatinivorum]|uniref:Uncharacterized protein n=1 Tax=Leucosporidium creatinivorum TaxID=106004 RepID=A0A1Y2FVY9_9BASI|nr:hypothetical protein BCR35DRAFT_330368 [Leucosporidium creatinivorum]
MFQIGLYGFLISHLINLRSAPTWTRSERWTHAVCYGVTLLNTAYTGLVCHDIWYYGTLPDRSYGAISDGAIPQSVEPIVLSSIAFVVQMTLAIMKRPCYRYLYRALIGCTAIVTFLAAVAVVATLVRWHYGNSSDWAPGVSLRASLIVWMWGSCSIDITITIVYLIQLRRTLRGRNHNSDSVVLIVGRLTVRSAAYTAFFAALVAIMAQLYCDSWTLFDVSYAFCMPLGSLYTLSLFTTLTIPDVVERELGAHVAQIPSSHPSALLTLNSSGYASTGPAGSRIGGYEVERDTDRESEKAFEWARSPGVKAEGLV